MSLPRPLALFSVFAVVAAAAGTLWWATQAAPPLPGPEAPIAASEDPAAPAPVAPATADGVGLQPERQAAPKLAAAAAPGVPSGPVRGVTGRVVDEAGQPVAGARVVAIRFGAEFDPAAPDAMDRLRDFDPATLTERLERMQREAVESRTEADGTFRLDVAGVQRALPLRVRARGYALLDQNVAVARDSQGEIDAGTLTVRTASIVSGRVVDGAGNGVAGAQVAIEGGGRMRREAVSEAPGAAAGPGRRDSGGRDTGGGGTGGGGAMGGMGGADFWTQMPGMDRFAGIFGEEVTTAADGSFELQHVEPGERTLRARHADHPTARRDGLVAVAGGVLADIVVALAPGARIEGRLVGLPAGATGLRVLAAPRGDERPAPGGAAAAEGPFAAFGGFDMGELGEVAQDFGFGGERDVEVAADGAFVLRGLRQGAVYRVFASQRQRGFVANAVCSDRREVAAPASGVELTFDAGIQVTFQVVDRTSKAPVETLLVEDRLRGGGGMEAMMAMAPSGARTRQYPDGRVVLASLRPKAGQKLGLVVEALGYGRFERRDIELPKGGVLDLGVVELTPGPVLRVQVVAKADGRAVADASVRLQVADAGASGGGSPLERLASRAQGEFGQFGQRSPRTDAMGVCLLNAPADGKGFTLAITHREFAPFTTAEQRAERPGTIELPVQLTNGGQVEVRVVDIESRPVANARVERAGPDGRRDTRAGNADGVVVFDRLTAGEHRFRIATRGGGGPDFGAVAAQFGQAEPTDGPGWQRTTVVDGERGNLQLRQEPQATLRGIVRENGQPLARARVNFAEGAEDTRGGEMARMMADFGGGGRGRSGRTGDDGSFELRNLPIGSHRLRVTVEGRAMPAVVPVTLGYGQNMVDVALDVASVRGSVLGPDGQPVAGASVSVSVVRAPAATTNNDPLAAAVEEAMPGGMDMMAGAMGNGRSVRTGDDGSFELRGVQPGVSLRVRATARGFAAIASEPFEVAAGQQRDGLELRLLASGKVAVTIGNASGPFTVVRARLLDAAGQPVAGGAPVMQQLRKGKATLDGLQAGSWRIEWVAGMDGVRDSRVVQVVPGQTIDLTF